MVYKEYKNNSYNLYTIKTDKFKLCHIEIIFRNNVLVKDLSKRNMLFDLLCESSKKYPTKREMALELENLYNTDLYNVTSKVGNSVISNICADFISPDYIDEDISKDVIQFLFEIIFNPLAENKEFDSKTFSLVKARIVNEIKSIKENPRKYALAEALKSLNGPSSSLSIGSLEDLSEVTPENLYQYYLDVLSHDFVDIYVVGNLDMDKINETILNYAKFKMIKNHIFEMYNYNDKRKTLVKGSDFNASQSNIVFILNLNKLSDYEKKYVANIYNIILGGGSLESKLYKSLRGENSLCYNVSSMYQKYDGLILIVTAVDINASSKAIKLIKETLSMMEKDISDTELENAKKLIYTSLNMNKDSIGKIVDNYFYQNVSDLDDFDTRMKTFSEITKDDIYKLSKKISINTIYTLRGSINEEN